jgi:hypothetical protein
MATDAPPHGWRRDEHGDLYRLLTPSEREQVIASREERDVDADASTQPRSEAEVERAA